MYQLGRGSVPNYMTWPSSATSATRTAPAGHTVDVRLPGKGNSNSHGARNSLSLAGELSFSGNTRFRPCEMRLSSSPNMAHISQSRPDSGLGFQVKVLKCCIFARKRFGAADRSHTHAHSRLHTHTHNLSLSLSHTTSLSHTNNLSLYLSLSLSLSLPLSL